MAIGDAVFLVILIVAAIAGVIGLAYLLTGDR